MRWLGTLLCLGMTYPSSLSDTEWDHLQCYLPPTQTRGRPRSHSLRAILNAIFYVLRTGCPWRYLPRDFLPWQTLYYHFRRFRLSGMWRLILTSLRTAERQRVGRDAQPTAAIIDTQSMKTVEESAPISGYDAHKRTSRGGNGICWWIALAYRSRFTSRRQMSKTAPEQGACSLGSKRLCPV